MKRLALWKVLAAIIATAFMTVVVGSAYAAIPQTMSYQGYLTDASGVPVDGNRSMVFSLYNVASGGTALWSETQSAVTVSNGIYQVTLGSVEPLTLAFDVPYWLGVTIGGDTEMTPRQALSSAPYALRALTSGDASGNLTITGNLQLPAGGIIMSGSNTLLHTHGNDNFFAGVQAGNLTMTGNDNTASGSLSLYFNTTGYQNTASGYQSLAYNTTGYENTASGSLSLCSNNTGSANTASGAGALLYNTAGSYNTASGSRALYYNTTAGSNTALGAYALNSQTFHNGGTPWVSNNTAVGSNALRSNAPTTTNNGIENTALGANALYSNTTGYYNTASGYRALYNNTTGNYNTAVGYYADVASGNLTNATAIGYNAKVSQSNSLVLGGTGTYAVKVGIGTTAPTEALDVVGNVRLNDKDVYLRLGSDTNHGIGWYGNVKLFASTNIDGPVVYGSSGGALGTTSGGQKILMKWDTSSLDFYGYSKFHVVSGGSTSVCLDLNNTLSTCSSDARMKKDVTPLPESMDVLDALSRLRGVTFTWDKSNAKAAGMSDGRDLGMIAQEVEQVFPEVVHTDEDGYKSMDYPKLVAFLVEVNKAQQSELGDLASHVQGMQKELEELKRLIAQNR